LFYTGFTSALLAPLHYILDVVGLIPGMEISCTDSFFLILRSPWKYRISYLNPLVQHITCVCMWCHINVSGLLQSQLKLQCSADHYGHLIPAPRG